MEQSRRASRNWVVSGRDVRTDLTANGSHDRFSAMRPHGNILIVDDNLELADNLAEILGTVGYRAKVAASAEGALAELRTGGCDAMITDFRLPGRNGAELIATLREAGNRIPV